jgi:hypothetical protein
MYKLAADPTEAIVKQDIIHEVIVRSNGAIPRQRLCDIGPNEAIADELVCENLRLYAMTPVLAITDLTMGP